MTAIASSDGDKDSDGPSESGDNTSESTQGAPSEPAQEKGNCLYVCTEIHEPLVTVLIHSTSALTKVVSRFVFINTALGN